MIHVVRPKTTVFASPFVNTHAMRMEIALRHGDTYLLTPIQVPVKGWSIRSGTFRVAKPYDNSTDSCQISPLFSSRGTELDTTSTQDSASPPVRKKQKLPKRNKKDTSGDAHDEATQWILSQFHTLLEQKEMRSYIEDIQGDYFYGTSVDVPADNTFALNLVELQPTMRMLKSGFMSTGDMGSDKSEETTFEDFQLRPDLQQLDLSDIYETLVVNNNSDPAIISFPIEGSPRYLIPPHSGFIISDLDRIHGLKSIAKDREGFDIIVMDPPWQNASVDRMSHYRTMDLYELFKIPIPDLLKANGSNVGGIVAVWITNKAKVKRVVVEKLFPAWGLDLVAHWFWLKVTTKGEPVLSLSNSHRRAYEGVLIGRQRQGSKLSNKTMHETSASNPVNRLLVSIPAQHSRKPSLNALIEEEFFTSKLESRADRDRNAYVDSEALVKKPLYRLELFARNLEEGVLSWGNEPLRYQYCGRGASNSQVVQDGYLIPCPIQSELVSQ